MSKSLQSRFFLAFFFAVFCSGAVNRCISARQTNESESRSPTFKIPEQVMAGAPLVIQLRGLKPHAKVQIEAKRLFGWTEPRRYRSSIEVKADSDGNIDLSQQAPIVGSESSYQGVQPLGLLWSMKLVSEDPVSPHEKDFVLLEAKVLSSNGNDESKVIHSKFEIVKQDPRVKEFPLSDQPELEGAFVMMMPTTKPRPVIITLGGSEGGDMSARRTAPTLASMGFAVVGFPYYSPAYGGGKPQFANLPHAFSEIPLDRIELVLEQIEAHPDLDQSRVGLHGVSKGGEYVLAAASRFDRFKAVAAFVPSDVIWEGWGTGGGPTSSFSFRGESLPFVPYQGMGEAIAKLRRGEKATIRIPHDAGRSAFPDRVAPARIQVDNIHASLMVVGGDQDQVWDSGGMCRNIVKTRKEAGLETQAWISSKAGHYLSGHAYNPMSNIPEEAAFRTETFPAMVEFFSKSLQLEPKR